jgi:hypothetical protein
VVVKCKTVRNQHQSGKQNRTGGLSSDIVTPGSLLCSPLAAPRSMRKWFGLGSVDYNWLISVLCWREDRGTVKLGQHGLSSHECMKHPSTHGFHPISNHSNEMTNIGIPSFARNPIETEQQYDMPNWTNSFESLILRTWEYKVVRLIHAL